MIRAGATRSARVKAAALICATETTVVTTPEAECIKRVVARNRPRPPLKVQIAAVKTWWSKYEPEGPSINPVNVTKRDW